MMAQPGSSGRRGAVTAAVTALMCLSLSLRLRQPLSVSS